MTYINGSMIVEAIQFMGTGNKNVIDVYNFLEGTSAESQMEIKSYGENFEIDLCNGTCIVGDIILKTLEGNKRVKHGDYIIKDIKGEFYPCKPDIFETSYELLEETVLIDTII